MKTGFRYFSMLLMAMMLVSCAGTPAALSQTPTPSLSSTPIPLPLPTAIIPDMPDPALWAASLKLTSEEYPKVDGSTATIPLAVYMRSKITGEPLSVSTGKTAFSTTGPSYLALDDREADLLVVYEPPKEIKAQLGDLNDKFLIKPIGLDALVFLTNKGNPVNSLTPKQIVNIYTGKTKKWNQVGGNDAAIIPYQRTSDSGSQALMLKLVMKNTKIMDAPAVLYSDDMGTLIDDIASYENTNNAIGYSVYYYVRNMYSVPGIKLLSVGGIAPNAETIVSGAYPYVNPFYAVIRKDEPSDSPAHKLFDWLTGQEGKRAVKDAGYVAVK